MGAAPAVVDEFRTPRPIAGWRIVLTAFCMALFAWGLGFYGLSLYVQALGHDAAGAAGWSPTLLSAATTAYFLLGAAGIFGVERAAARFGRRRTAIAGVLLLAGGAAALPVVTHAGLLFAAYAAMALGWSATSGTAVSQVIGAWFDRRRGLALNLALTGASAAGVLIVPPMAWCIARFGAASGLALVTAVLAVAMIALLAFNLVEPDPREARGAGAADGVPAAPSAPAPADSAATAAASAAPLRAEAHLVRICALFAIGWLAQVAFLAQQLPILVPRIGEAWATAAVAATTASSLAGRLALAAVIDRIDHRWATAGSFLLQAAGMAMVLLADAPAVALAGCCLFGASVGNVITLPAIYAQREFPPSQYGGVVNRVWSIGQVLFAFGPLGAGALQAWTGTAAWTLLACLALQVGAAALCVPGRREPGRPVAASAAR
jgi:MFS family permease